MLTMGADEIDEAVAHACGALRAAATAEYDWTRPAGGLEWSCLATAEHVVSDFTAYAAQLTGRTKDAYVPLDVRLEEGTGPAAAVHAVEASGGLLAAVVRTTPRGGRGFHPFPYGSADAHGFAAMGIVELLLHTYDVLSAFDVAYEPPARLCEALLAWQFPHVPPARDGASHWRTLLWATGRGTLPGRSRLERWRWHNQIHLPAGPVALLELSPPALADLAAGGAGGLDWIAGGPCEGTRTGAGLIAKAYATGTHRPEWGSYAIVRTADQVAVGAMGFHGVPDHEGWAEVGYDLAPEARGNGYATQALRALSRWALDLPDVRGIRAVVDEGNTASEAVLLRAGFERDADREGRRTYTIREG
ncbi:GNAT family N-acetyltransferase [Streptomyces sp. AN091965]|uniref:GNAT family N-acetyltransferase n=1 Tax=Streptomyces sp. AN091965 TaxID=2927803 RepID=UPI001F615418|nr:GNAT family N-acetyltransferase [Streptomyces sp. AN091965]MCI3931451.1 GNAT family N-acetyltransferase [Streptomyces sp. AN091965]